MRLSECTERFFQEQFSCILIRTAAEAKRILSVLNIQQMHPLMMIFPALLLS